MFNPLIAVYALLLAFRDGVLVYDTIIAVVLSVVLSLYVVVNVLSVVKLFYRDMWLFVLVNTVSTAVAYYCVLTTTTVDINWVTALLVAGVVQFMIASIGDYLANNVL